MIFAEPFQKAYKSCVNFQNVRTDSSRLPAEIQMQYVLPDL